MSITVFNANRHQADEKGLLEMAVALPYLGVESFSEKSIAVLAGISQRLLSDNQAKRQPQLVALGYWLRKSALKRFSENAQSGDAGLALRVPRGLALHLPPTNVDTIFVYSWAVSVLAGNANLVRLPTTPSEATCLLVDIIVQELEAVGEGHRHIFCSFPHAGSLLQDLSRLADLRLIWGGDAKVAEVSKHPIQPDGLSIGFPDRQSYSIISADAYANASEAQRNELANHYVNDIFWFDQLGCGSPRILFWLGGDDTESRQDLYARIAATADKKGHDVAAGTAISKFALSNDLVAAGHAQRATRVGSKLEIAQISPHAPLLKVSQGGGFLFECRIEKLEMLTDYLTRKVQTITYFGLEQNALTSMQKLTRSRGGYRIIPVGEALQFDPIWDGVDLIGHFSRLVTVR